MNLEDQMKADESKAREKFRQAFQIAVNIYERYYSPYSKIKSRYNFYDVCDLIDYRHREHYVVLAAGEDGRISFARNPKDKYVPSKKTRMLFSRYVRRVLKIKSNIIPDRDLEAFQIAFKLAIVSKEKLLSSVKVLKGEDIVKFYETTLVVSCMTGSENSDKIKFYAENSDKVSLVVLDNLARALMWETSAGTFVDRIYGSEMGVSIINHWTNKNNYLSRDKLLFRNANVTVSLKMTPKTPCLDTLCYGRLSNNGKEVCISCGINIPGEGRLIRFTDAGDGWRFYNYY